MRTSRRVFSGGSSKYGSRVVRGTVTVNAPGEAPTVRGPRADGLTVGRKGAVVLVCGNMRPTHRWARADAPPNAPGGPWLQCGDCGWWTRPEGYKP